MPAQRRLDVLSNHVITAASVSAAGIVGVDEIAHYEKGTHFGVLPDYEHPILLPKAGFLSETNVPPVTMPEVLTRAAKNVGDTVALAVERPCPAPEAPGVAPALPWSDWTKWTWNEYLADSRRAAKAFMQLGVKRFGSVCIFGFNSPEWCICSWGAIFCGAKYVGIYLTDTPEQVQYKVAHSGSAVIFVDGDVEYQAVACKVDDMPGLQAIVVREPSQTVTSIIRKDGTMCKVCTFDELLKMGEASRADQELEARITAQRPGHCCGIIYTSGTTGHPKAVMMHHDAVTVQGAWVSHPESGLLDAFKGGARIISYLPLSHIAGATVDIFGPSYMAGMKGLPGTVYFARPYDLREMTLGARLAFVRPTFFFAVPRVYEKMQAKMMAVGASITGLKKQIATWAKGKGLTNTKNLQLGGSKSTPMFHGLADKIILSKARDALGLDQCKAFVTGAAPISMETLEYFGSLGMIIQNVYGMSESGGIATLCTVNKNVFGTVGHCMPGAEFKCFKSGPNGENVEVPRCKPGTVPTEAEQGELCYRGRHIMMGYMANSDFGPEHISEMEDKNRSAIDDEGWLHSGDKGCIDTNGMVKITGRYKELIIGAGGENIAPVPVEEGIKSLCPALSNVMMVGDNRRYNVALVTLLAEGATGEFPGTDNLMGAALEVNPEVKTISEAINDPVWQKYIQAGIDVTNNNPNVCISNAWKIQKFKIVPRDFSIQTGELTATLKLKRSVAESMWLELIDSMY